MNEKSKQILRSFKINKLQVVLLILNALGCILYPILFFTFNKNSPTNNNWDSFLFYALPVISILATISNLFCLILLANKRIENFYFGIVAVILFAIISICTKNWLFAFLNGGYYLLFNTLGIFSWGKGTDLDTGDVKNKYIKKRITFYSLLFGSILTGIAISFLFVVPAIKKGLGDNGDTNDYAYWIKLIANGASMILCMVAMQLALRAYREQWNFWVIANSAVLVLWIFNVVEYANTKNWISLYTSVFTLFTYLLGFPNSIYGYINWKKKKILIIFSGAQKTGKTTIAKSVCKKIHAAYISNSSTLNDKTEYNDMCSRVEDNIKNGVSVVIDSIDNVSQNEAKWKSLALNHNIDYGNVEIICSDYEEWKKRIDTKSCDHSALKAMWHKRSELPLAKSIIVDSSKVTMNKAVRAIMHQIKS
ncbi:MAG: hypothetical protein Ta2E_02760 [Mycoplasmoidaceae bacterium]|nr:MAG: hypothetical protein Ta2E_02760 [Mycoplasmoidaceae bacterium]